MKAIFLTFSLIFCFNFSPPGNQQAAFRHFFKGNIAFQTKDFKKATNHFKQAYQLLPDNFDIALSYAVSLSMSKGAKRGIEVIQKIKLKSNAPDYQHKKVLKYFASGIIYSYHKKFGKAILSFRKALQAASKESPHLLSNIYNAMGYAVIMNQNVNIDKGTNLDRHLHVLKADMKRAFTHFQKAVKLDSRNENAQYNYRTLRDTLQIYAALAPDTTVTTQTPLSNRYIELSEDVFTQIPLSGYNEVVLMLDISGSMVQEKVACKGVYRFEVMREAVLYMLKNLPDSVSVGIGTIGGDCGTTPRLWIHAGSKNRKELIQEIEFLVPDGTTPLISILKRAPELLVANNRKKKAVFLISDGENVCKIRGADLCQWANKRPNTTIEILTFLDARLNNANAFSEYSCLTENTGGKIHYIDNNYCRLQQFSFGLVDAYIPRIPPLKRVQCWGGRYQLWGVFEGF